MNENSAAFRRLANFYTRGVGILKNVYQYGRQSLGALMYGANQPRTVRYEAREPQNPQDHFHMDMDDLGIPANHRVFDLDYQFKTAGNGRVRFHRWSVIHGDADNADRVGFEYAKVTMIRSITAMLVHELRDSPAMRVQIKVNLSGVYVTSNFFEVTRSLSEEDVEKAVDECINGNLTVMVEKALQSKEDRLGFVEEFSMNTTDVVQPISRASAGRVTGSYIPTPPSLKNRKGLINIKNLDDHECFKYAVCAAIHHDAFTRRSRSTASNWKPFFKKYEWGNMCFPITLTDIQVFEDMNPTVAVNVMSWDADEHRIIRERATTYADRQTTIWLMIIEDETKTYQHFMSVIDPATFLASGKSCKKLICPTCWSQFSSRKPFDDHLRKGCLVHGKAPNDAVPSVDRGIYFNDWDNRMKSQQHTVFYADFEAFTRPETINTRTLGRQEVLSYNFRCVTHERASGHKLTRHHPPVHNVRPAAMSRDDFIYKFMQDLQEAVKVEYDKLRIVEPMIMSKEDRLRLVTKARKCCLCQKFFASQKETRHAHHNHKNGKFIGAAHPKCNLDSNFECVRFPVFFHNFTGYDSHLILEGSSQALSVCPEHLLHDLKSCFSGKIEVIAENEERFKTIVLSPKYPPAHPGMRPPNIKIEFKDSMAFNPGSLEGLVASLAKTDTKQFKVLRKHVNSVLPKHKAAEGFKMMLRKGVFPHKHIDSIERLQETSLPPIEAFYNDLKGEPCSTEDYEHAQTVWKFFKHKTLGDYHDLYLNSDTALLADVMENHRSNTLESYGIELCSKVGAPGVFWSAMLKQTGKRLTQLTDLDKVHLFERHSRGGVTYTASQYAKANNKHTPGYDPSKKSTYILYLDANSLYPWAMCEPLPYGDFHWVPEEFLDGLLKISPKDTDKVGYTLEVDLHAPDTIHDAEAEFPLLCENTVIPESHFSPHISKKHTEKRTEARRLINHLLPVKNYVVSLPMLHYMREKGYVVDKIHRAVRFSQSKWMKPYIDSCVSRRQEAKRDKNKVLADLHKLSMNSVFGKSIENVRNRSDYKFAHTEDGILKLTNKHNFRGCSIITPDSKPPERNRDHPVKWVNRSLVGVMLARESVMLDKPIYIGSTILDTSKIRMHKFYDKMKAQFPTCKFLYTDTDSLILEVESDDIYEDLMHPDIVDEFDFDDSKRCHNNNPTSVPGFMKLEPYSDCHVSEFIGLFNKGYAAEIIGTDGQLHPKEPYKCTSKGFRMPSNRETFETYKRCLFDDVHDEVKQTRLRSHDHGIYVEKQTRLGAYASIGDKRYPLERKPQEGSFDSLPFGHYKIRPKSL